MKILLDHVHAFGPDIRTAPGGSLNEIQVTRSIANSVCLTIRFKKHLTPHITGSTINETLNETLNTAVLSTYELIKGSPGINRKELINRSGCAASTLSRHIVILTEKGLIEQRGSKKVGGYYAK